MGKAAQAYAPRLGKDMAEAGHGSHAPPALSPAIADKPADTLAGPENPG